MHGNEVGTVKLALKNPDYANGGRIGRFNANNVDLNRNFPTPSFTQKSVWCFGENYKENVTVNCGKSGNSEPETKALTDFIKKTKIDLIYSFHNAGRDLMAGQDPVSQKLAKLFAKKSGFRLFSNEDWLNLKQTGTAKEWCEINNIRFMEIEGSTRFASDFIILKPAIFSTLLEFLATGA